MSDAEITDDDQKAAQKLMRDFPATVAVVTGANGLAQTIANARAEGIEVGIGNRLEVYEMGHEEGRREGLEEAAKWHDEQADEWHISRDPEGGGDCREYEKQHRADAKAIRALMETT